MQGHGTKPVMLNWGSRYYQHFSFHHLNNRFLPNPAVHHVIFGVGRMESDSSAIGTNVIQHYRWLQIFTSISSPTAVQLFNSRTELMSCVKSCVDRHTLRINTFLSPSRTQFNCRKQVNNNGCLTQLLFCFITAGEGVFTERCVLMEGVGVCDVTHETAEFTWPILPVAPSTSHYFYDLFSFMYSAYKHYPFVLFMFVWCIFVFVVIHVLFCCFSVLALFLHGVSTKSFDHEI
jgi:hypothetical protein